MTTEQMEILHELIEVLVESTPFPVIRAAVAEKFGEDRLDDLQEALEDLAGEAGYDVALDVDELR